MSNTIRGNGQLQNILSILAIAQVPAHEFEILAWCPTRIRCAVNTASWPNVDREKTASPPQSIFKLYGRTTRTKVAMRSSTTITNKATRQLITMLRGDRKRENSGGHSVHRTNSQYKPKTMQIPANHASN